MASPERTAERERPTARAGASGRPALAVAVGIAGLAVTAAFLYPGYHNGDTYWQYWQARTGLYSSWHPVFMAWLWHWLDRVVPGTGALFVLNASLFWAGQAFLAERFSRTRAGLVFLGAVPLLLAPVYALLGQVTKDTGMAAGLVFGFGAWAQAEGRRSAVLLGLSLLGLWYALAVRHNGASAVLAVTVAVAAVAVRDHLPPRAARALGTPLRVAALGLALCLALMAVSAAASSAILGSHGLRARLQQQFLSHDLVGISVRTGRNYLPDVFRPGEPPFSLEELRALYHPYSGSFLYWGPPGPRRLLLTDPLRHWRAPLGAKETATLTRAWWEAVRREPRAYLAHRAELFLGQLGLRPGTPLSGIAVAPPQDQGFVYYGPTTFDLPHHRWLRRQVDRFGDTLLLTPWPYVALSLLCVVAAFALRSTTRYAQAVLGASVALLVGALFFVGVHSAARYLWWCMIAGVTQAALLAVGAAERRCRPRPASPPA